MNTKCSQPRTEDGRGNQSRLVKAESDLAVQLKKAGFTLIELLVILAMVAVMGGLLAPALGRAKFPSAVANCTSNYRQWGVVVNLYANDNRSAYPSYPITGSGNNIWDVSLAMIDGLKPYGLTVPKWFCPVRPEDFAAVNGQCLGLTGHPLVTLDDLKIGIRFPSNSATATFGTIYHDLWIPRRSNGTAFFPSQWNSILGVPNVNANEKYQWPSRTTDSSVTKVPILSDRVVAAGTTVSTIFKNGGGAHFSDGVLQGVNVLYGDGRVEQHSAAVMQWRWKGVYYTFY